MDPGTNVSVEDRRVMASNPMESLSLAQDDPEVKGAPLCLVLAPKMFGTNVETKKKRNPNKPAIRTLF